MATALTLGLAFNFSNAQDFGEIMSAGTEDANTYLENYAAPVINSFGVGLAGGWYNTAKAHKTLGFDLTVSFNMAAVPNEDMMFDFAEAGFRNLQLRGDSDGMVPTLAGGDAENGSELYIEAGQTINGVTIEDEVTFDVPSGFNLSEVPVVTGVPTPTFNLGVGIYKNTDLKLRFIPQQNIDGYKFGMFGIGLMHDVKQWIPGIKNLPFDLSGFFGTTTMTAEKDIEVNNQDGSTSFEGSGVATFKTNSTTVQAIISKKLAVLTPYAALGFNAVKTTFDVSGDYTVETEDPLGQTQSETVSDPIDLTFKGAGGARLTLGARLKLAVFTFHYAYTLQKYNTHSFGFGINVR